jgi:formate hydrogenlyase subunit 3/multisubunit Na+/H+ antiporter MnhD subunit
VSPIAGPVLLLAMPLLAAAVTYLFRHLSFIAALLSVAVASLLAFLCLRLPLDRSAFVLGQEVAFGRPVVVLGQTLALNQAGQMWLGYIFVLMAVFYLFAGLLSQGRSFFPFSLAILTLYALVVLVQTFALAILVLAISVALSVFILQAGQLTPIRGAQRYLVVTLLAVPLLLIAGWFVDQAMLEVANASTLAEGTTPVTAALGQTLARRALLPAALGFGLLLAVFPFGTWMPALAAGAPPMSSAFVFTAGQAMALYLALSFLTMVPAFLDDSITLAVIQLAGLGMAASGGLMAAVQRDFGRLLGYAALSDLGILILAFSSGGSQGLVLALLHGISRTASIGLMAAALSVLRHRATTDRFASLRGVARRLPLATGSLILGGLALAGFPFTAGFPTHWAIGRSVWNWVQPFSPAAQEALPGIQAVPGQEWLWHFALAALVASSLGIVIGVLRGLNAMRGNESRDDIARQPILASAVMLALAAFNLLLGFVPHLFLEPVSNAAQVFLLF